jgi:metal-responsive CopG/Arc/MetJ family transcriptional regulator
MQMAKSIRVETYLSMETIQQIDDRTDNRSEFIRQAIHTELDE